jgi:hypothetical protein
MSDQQLDQMLGQVQTREDLEDFMAYYQFDEKEKNKCRGEFQENTTQDRGLGKVLLAGIGAVIGWKALRRIFGRRNYRSRAPWQPGMGGVKRSVPAEYGGGYGTGFQDQFQQQGYNQYQQQQFPSQMSQMQQQPWQGYQQQQFPYQQWQA